MAISEICKFEVKQEIDSCVEEGMSRNEASKWLADVFADALGRDVKPETIRKKDYRAREDIGTNVPTKSQPLENTTNKTWVCPECYEEFRLPFPVAHCLHCDHHYPKSDGECSNCHESLKDAPEAYAKPSIIKNRKPQGGGQREGAGRPAKPTKIHEVTEAMDFATIAISQLRRIRGDDPKRKEALLWVKQWICKNMNKKEKT